jgi:hypothetical protein
MPDVSIQEAPFLTGELRRSLFCDNTARFLPISPDEIARHLDL